jgi:uncharacterized protein (DUF1330 family)
MAAYMISDVNIINAERYEEYRLAVRTAVDKYGGRYIVRGGSAKVLEGTWNPARVVIVEFSSMAEAEKFYESPEFLKAKQLRQNAAMVNMILTDGL